ncbi:MAG: 4-hydroxythreonine-4-phosphate dehydrogenase PdxA, partial [Planctomycetota bacterium]
MKRQSPLPTIGLTMGDPAGVGPELVLRALQSTELAEKLQLVVLGSRAVLETQIAFAGSEMPPVEFLTLQEFRVAAKSPTPTCRFVDIPTVNIEGFETCQVSNACGKASFDFIQAAIDLALDGMIDAVTTCPINKAALSAAGLDYPGHTEMFAERCPNVEAPERWCMMQFSEEITCTFATTHVGYHEVPKLLTRQRVHDTISLTAEAIRLIHGREPRLVVCGLNPHAGEGGLFGSGEEEAAIIPAIEELRSEGLEIVGPVPGDTAFLQWRREQTDAFVCMYHDQGHIPVKALAFDKAV